MESQLAVLLPLAVGIGFTHTLIGIDHTLPFLVLGRARGWSLARVLALTAVCGLGHVLSSVLLGALGLGLGVAVGRLEFLEAVRGDLASWALIFFGLTYAAWSFSRERRQHVHTHDHDGEVHVHVYQGSHCHRQVDASTVTGWTLFLVFVLGPCEPLIPLLLAPALQQSAWAVALVALTFGTVTIATMLGVVALGWVGMTLTRLHGWESRANTLAGLAVAGSGLAIKLFGF